MGKKYVIDAFISILFTVVLSYGICYIQAIHRDIFSYSPDNGGMHSNTFNASVSGFLQYLRAASL